MSRRTLDTNVAIYAFSPLSGKNARATEVLAQADFMSVQLLNEFAQVFRRKIRLEWPDIRSKLADLREAVDAVLPVTMEAHEDSIRIASRYKLSLYDGLMLSVALNGGARTFYSEDMHHGLVIDDTLKIVNPFLPDAA